jgi:hypothetical protein
MSQAKSERIRRRLIAGQEGTFAVCVQFEIGKIVPDSGLPLKSEYLMGMMRVLREK